MFLYPLYILNFKKDFNAKDFSVKVASVFLLLITLLTFQSLVVGKGIYSGDIGNFVIDSMFPFIGLAGLWIFVIIGFVISFLILLEDSDIKIDPKKLVPKFKKVDTSSGPKRIENKRKPRRKSIKSSNGAVTVKEEGNIAEIVIEETIDNNVANIEVDDLNIINLEQTQEDIEIKESELFDDIVEDISVEEEHPHALIVEELEENKKLQDEIELGNTEKPKDFELPSVKFFQSAPKEKKSRISEAQIDKKIADILEKLLHDPVQNVSFSFEDEYLQRIRIPSLYLSQFFAVKKFLD